MPHRKIEKRLRIAGILVALGLVILFLTIFWNHPLAFVVFLAVGVPITLAGILLYLFSLLAFD
jgi:energy-converting hydrogenase Eha subunit E